MSCNAEIHASKEADEEKFDITDIYRLTRRRLGRNGPDDLQGRAAEGCLMNCTGGEARSVMSLLTLSLRYISESNRRWLLGFGGTQST